MNPFADKVYEGREFKGIASDGLCWSGIESGV